MTNVYINQDAIIPSVLFTDQIVDPTMPSGGGTQLYSKTGRMYCIDDVGTVTGPFGALDDPRFVTPGGRLTLVSGVAFPYLDVNDISTSEYLYYVPYVHPFVPIYDGVKTVLYEFDTLIIPLSVPSNNVYDIFICAPSGVLQLELEPWTDSLTRNAFDSKPNFGLSRLDGKYTKYLDYTRLYLGSIYMSPYLVGGSPPYYSYCEHSLSNKGVWNYYNRIDDRFIKISQFNAPSHAVNTNMATSYWNGNSSANNISLVIGVPEDTVTLGLSEVIGTTAGYSISVCLDKDSDGTMKTFPADIEGGWWFPQVVLPGYKQSDVARTPIILDGKLRASDMKMYLPWDIGYHTFTILEYSSYAGGVLCSYRIVGSIKT
jgi:hypothetical protein